VTFANIRPLIVTTQSGALDEGLRLSSRRFPVLYDASVTFPKTPKSNAWRIDPDRKVKLSTIDPAGTPEAPNDGDRDATEKATRKLREDLRELQGALQGEESRSILLILQAMDTGGKDGTVKNIYLGVNPVGVEISSFGVPSEAELAHDFLWRIHAKTPPRGKIGIFNRSQYEDVLAVRVRNIAPPSVWKPRYELINDFERNLDAGGTVVVKMMLHISFEEQRARLQARIDRPEKRWKFRLGDIEDRKLWGEYQKAYDDALSATSTEHAPWFVIQGDKKWYRDFAVLTILNDVLRGMKPKYPEHEEFAGIIVP
jgi:PPK2 family polyphosphate:nucleotide phosphotransferase